MEIADEERVLPVGREVVLDLHAAAGAERQPFEVVALVVAGPPIDAAARLHLGAPDGLPRDVARGGDVLLEEGRRDRRASATLSNPSLLTSFGSTVRASMRTPSSDSTARAYSVRFSRCSTTGPGSV